MDINVKKTDDQVSDTETKISLSVEFDVVKSEDNK